MRVSPLSPLRGAGDSCFLLACMGRLVERLWYRTDESLVARVLCWPLWLVSLVWGALARRRVEKARLPGRARRVEAKVISVGNITAGGAGKTPVVIHLARRLVAKGEGLLADRILMLAKQHGIPVERDPDLLAALAPLQVDRVLPPELFKAVAIMLAALYRANGQADRFRW